MPVLDLTISPIFLLSVERFSAFLVGVFTGDFNHMAEHDRTGRNKSKFYINGTFMFAKCSWFIYTY